MARDWITRPAVERAQLEAAGWQYYHQAFRKHRWGRGYTSESVVVMWRDRVVVLEEAEA